MKSSWKFVLPIFVSACTASGSPSDVSEDLEGESAAEIRSNACSPVPRAGALVEVEAVASIPPAGA